jgi:hypothetical protein
MGTRCLLATYRPPVAFRQSNGSRYASVATLPLALLDGLFEHPAGARTS